MRNKVINGFIVLFIGILISGAGCSKQQMPAKTPEETKTSAPPVENTLPDKAFKTHEDLNNPMDKMSYSFGVETYRNLQKQQLEVNPAALCQGIMDAADEDLLMDKAELEENYAMFQSMARAIQIRARSSVAQENIKKGAVFLAENKQKEGVVTLPSGLQYKIIKEGNGPKPKVTDTIKCYYVGTLVDGTIFDSSTQKVWDQGQPAIVPLANCIPGWKEAIPMMPVGSKWQLFIPSDLAYGINGSGRLIGPNATLIYEVELVGIQNQ